MLFSLRISRMCPHVLSKVAGLGKSITARLADVRLLPRMPPHVPSQVAGLGERLAAHLADVRPLA